MCRVLKTPCWKTKKRWRPPKKQLDVVNAQLFLHFALWAGGWDLLVGLCGAGGVFSVVGGFLYVVGIFVRWWEFCSVVGCFVCWWFISC